MLAKIETFNPGNSIKDRMALQDDRGRRAGRRCSSRAARSSKAPPATPAWAWPSPRSSRATSASSPPPTSSRRRRSTRSRRSAPRSSSARPTSTRKTRAPTTRCPRASRREIPNCLEGQPVRQPVEHCRRTTSRPAPEIWEQTDGRITHLVVGVGTGGTISGVGRYLKERNPAIKVWGIDTYGSVFKKYKETGIFDKNEIYPYITEGIGEDFLPQNVDFSIIDALREGHRQGRGDHDAAHRARGGHLRRQLRRARRWPGCCSCATTSPATTSSW